MKAKSKSKSKEGRKFELALPGNIPFSKFKKLFEKELKAKLKAQHTDMLEEGDEVIVQVDDKFMSS